MLECREYINKRRSELKNLVEKNNCKPTLLVMIVGDDGSAMAYVKGIQRTGDKLGVSVLIEQYDESISEIDFISEIKRFNEDETVHGMMVQMPLPSHIRKSEVINTISPKKDLDGFTKENLGLLMLNEEGLFPCTAEAVMAIIEDANIDLVGKEVVIIGRSNVVGKPLGIMMLNQSATVTTVHSRTKDLKFHTKRADIVVVAVGKARFLSGEMIKKDALVIDVGINVVDNCVVGDVDFDDAIKVSPNITPVPGGVGGMTTTLLFEKVVKISMEE